MLRFAITVVASRLRLCQLFVILASTARPIVETFQLVVSESFCVEAPQDVLEVERSVLLVNQHHRRQVIIGVEVLKGILKQTTGSEESIDENTYLSDPLKWLGRQLNAVESKESDSSLRWNSDHEELVI